MADLPPLAPWISDLSMKPLLGAVVQEAVKLAVIDVVTLPAKPGDPPDQLTGPGTRRYPTDEERAAWRSDIFTIPDAALADIDPLALAQCVACRLLGAGGWTAAGVYGGNASPRELLEATFGRPDQRHVDDFASDLKRHMEESGALRWREEEDEGPEA
jgi:hypothetical protein